MSGAESAGRQAGFEGSGCGWLKVVVEALGRWIRFGCAVLLELPDTAPQHGIVNVRGKESDNETNC